MSDTSWRRVSYSLPLRYSLAVASSALALLLTLLLDDPSIEPNTLLLFIAAVVLSAWYGGLGPGLLATLLTTLAGSYYLLSLTATPTANDWGLIVRLIEFVAVSLLICLISAAQRAARQRAEAACAEAGAANRAKDEFLATVSHELRTPLNSILGWIRLLRTGQVDAATSAQGLDAIERNAKLQAQLIEDLLDVSRIVTGKLRFEARPVELAPVIEAALDVIRPAAQGKAIQLEPQLDPSVGPVSGDPDRLQQVVWNLLSNAVKFTPREGRVEVRLERADLHARITVCDTGPGIAPEFLPHVFERFSQADVSLKRASGGLGLGLAIVRHLVEMHGGTVEAKSAGAGQGAAFMVKLPLATAAKQPETAGATAARSKVIAG